MLIEYLQPSESPITLYLLGNDDPEMTKEYLRARRDLYNAHYIVMNSPRGLWQITLASAIENSMSFSASDGLALLEGWEKSDLSQDVVNMGLDVGYDIRPVGLWIEDEQLQTYGKSADEQIG